MASKTDRDLVPTSAGFRIRKQGWLVKEGRVVKSWKRRWFTLKAGVLFYYKSQADPADSMKGWMQLRGCQVFSVDVEKPGGGAEDPSEAAALQSSSSAKAELATFAAEDKEFVWAFAIVAPDRLLKCAARTPEDRDDWIAEIQRQIATAYYVELCRGRLRRISRAIEDGLTMIALDGCSLTLAEMKALSCCLADRKICPSVSELSLAGCSLTDMFVRPLAAAMANNISIELLDLSNNRLTDRGAWDFSCRLFTNCHLRKLTLRGNRIADVGADALSDAFRSHVSLREVDLSRNRIGPLGAHSVARCCSHLDTLNLSWNPVGDAGAAALAEHTLTGIRKLELESCSIGPSGLASLLLAVRSSTSLRSMNLRGNDDAFADPGSMEQLVDSLKQTRGMTSVRFSGATTMGMLHLRDLLRGRYSFSDLVMRRDASAATTSAAVVRPPQN